jgi:hypothetical protein
MKSRRPFSLDILFLFEALGLACYALLFLQSGTATVLSYGLKLGGARLALFLGLAAGFFFILREGAPLLAAREAKAFGAGFEERLRQNVVAAVPLLFLILSPSLNANYLTRNDLRTRLGLLGVFVAAAVLYLKIRDLLPYLKATDRGTLRALRARWDGLTLRRRLLVLFIAAFLVYNAGALILVQEGITFSGDEPNYLLTTHSLLYDKDINLANNYANQDYFRFYSKADNPRLRLGIYGRYGKKGKDYIYPINLPGISVLMLPWYWLSQLFAGKALTFILKGSLAIWAVLLGLQIYLLARDLWKREGLALGLWLFYSFSAPVFFYALHLYPEIPIALFSVYVYRKVISGAPLSRPRLLFMGFLLGTFAWFGLKYNFILGPLVLVALYHLWKSQRPRSKLLLFLVFPVLGTALFYYFVYTLYGTFSPFAVYEGIISADRTQALKAAWLAYPLWARTDSLFDYFLDQRDGLLLYAPFYFLMFAGAVEAFRKSKKELAALLFIALPFLLNYAFFTHRQGYCPQGRVLAPISWIGAILVGHFLAANKNRIFAAFTRLAAGATAAVTVFLLAHPSALYQSTTHEITQRPGELFLWLSSLKIFLPFLLPSFIKIDNRDYLPNYLWIAGMLLFAVLYAVVRGRTGPAAGPAATTGLSATTRSKARIAPVCALLAAAFILWVYYPRAVLYPSVPLAYADQQKLGFYLFPTGGDVVAKNQGELYLHADREYKIFFAARRKLPSIKLVFGSAAGTHDVVLRQFDLPLFKGRTDHERKEIVFTPAAAFPLRDLFIYEVVIDFKKLSGENLKVDPYLLQIIPGPRKS